MPRNKFIQAIAMLVLLFQSAIASADNSAFYLVTPTPIYEGDGFDISLEFENIGVAEAVLLNTEIVYDTNNLIYNGFTHLPWGSETVTVNQTAPGFLDVTIGAGNPGDVIGTDNTARVIIQFHFIASGPPGTYDFLIQNESLINASGNSVLQYAMGIDSTISPAIAITPNSVNFNALRGQTDNQTITVENRSSVNATSYTAIFNTTEYSIVTGAGTTCTDPIPAGGNCTIEIQFTAPNIAGTYNGTITVKTNFADAVADLVGTVSSPELQVTPSPSYDFGTVKLGDTALQTFTITNAGNADMHNVSWVLTGAGDFSVINDTCVGIVVAPAGTCQIQVQFSPTVAGTLTTRLDISAEDANGIAAINSPISVNLSGTGALAHAVLSPDPLDFGNVKVGTTATGSVTLRNTGPVDMIINNIAFDNGALTSSDFTITGNNCASPLAAGASCTIDLNYTPSAVGGAIATIQVDSDADNSPTTSTVQGTGALAILSFSPDPLDFGVVRVGTPKTLTVVMTNSGVVEADGIAPTITPADYTIEPSSTCSGTLPAGQSCKYDITFTPTAEGVINGTLTVTSDASTSPNVLALNGEGGVPRIELTPDPTDFGDVRVGQTATRTVTLKNIGQVDMNGINHALGGAGEFNVTGTTCTATLAPQGTCTYTVEFAPSGRGVQNDTLTVSSTDAVNSPVAVNLTGKGIAPEIAFNPANLDFGDVLVGQTNTLTVTMTNVGDVDMSNINAAISGGDFSIDTAATTCINTLVIGASCDYVVIFSPQQMDNQPQNATLEVTSDAVNSPQQVALQGRGVAPYADLTPDPLDFGDVLVGQTKVMTITLENTGTADLNPSAVTISGNNFFTIAADNCGAGPLAPNATCTYDIQFAPAGVAGMGAQTATFQLSSDALNAPNFVTLNGNGIAPEATLTPDPVDFGTVLYGQTADRQITLTNSGTAVMNNINASITAGTADYMILFTNCGATLNPSASCTYTVRFTSQSPAGIKTGTFQVTSDAINNPAETALTGEAVDMIAGDVDGDGDIDFADVLYAFNSVGQPNFPPAGDLDGDGDLDFADVLAIFNMIP